MKQASGGSSDSSSGWAWWGASATWALSMGTRSGSAPPSSTSSTEAGALPRGRGGDTYPGYRPRFAIGGFHGGREGGQQHAHGWRRSPRPRVHRGSGGADQRGLGRRAPGGAG